MYEQVGDALRGQAIEGTVSQKCASKGIGRCVDTWELLTKRAYALWSYALACAALITSPLQRGRIANELLSMSR